MKQIIIPITPHPDEITVENFAREARKYFSEYPDALWYAQNNDDDPVEGKLFAVRYWSNADTVIVFKISSELAPIRITLK